MKVLQFICPTGLFGAERWILALTRAIDPRRVHCQLAVTEESPQQDLEVVNRFEDLGFRAHRLRMSGRFDLRVIVRLAGLIRREGIQLIHTHGYKSDILGLVAARFAGIPALATPHGFENGNDAKLQFFIRLGCVALKHFDSVAPLSEELRDDMMRIGVSAKRTRLIMNGVDLEDVEEALRHETPSADGLGEKRIAYVGQLAQRKNLGDLIRAFNLLHHDRPATRLLLIGDGRDRRELEALARSLPCGSSVEFLGYREDRLAILRGCHLFAMTSSLEGIPRAMMEAMALGCPAAAFRIPGVDRLVIPGETGLLAQFGDVEGLKGCFETILFADGERERMGTQAALHVRKHFSGRRMAAEYAALFEEVLGAQR